MIVVVNAIILTMNMVQYVAIQSKVGTIFTVLFLGTVYLVMKLLLYVLNAISYSGLHMGKYISGFFNKNIGELY